MQRLIKKQGNAMDIVKSPIRILLMLLFVFSALYVGAFGRIWLVEKKMEKHYRNKEPLKIIPYIYSKDVDIRCVATFHL